MADQPLPHNRPIVTIDEARRLGLKRYFTGKPCSHGHFSERSTNASHCLKCQLVDVARRIEKDRTFILKRMAYNRRRYRRLYDSDPEFRRRLLLKTKNWKEKNPDRIRLAATCRSRKRWAIKRKADGHHTPNEIKALLVKQKKRCIYCLESLVVGYHVDHIKPLSKGGGNGIGNIQLLCPTCNLRKHAKDPIKWANEIGLLL